MAEDTAERPVDLVFQGGGVKGIALAGAYSVLEEEAFRPQNVAGTSAGAIVAVLIAAGYTGKELHDILGEVDFKRFLDRGWEDRLPLAGGPLGLVLDQGIFEGREILRWLRQLLAEKGVRRFGDLVRPDSAGETRYRYRAQVIAADVTHRRMLVLPQDAPHLGIEPDDLDVALAVRMSTSIPFFFEPVRRPGRAREGDHVIVDGGVLSNFPVWLFDTDAPPAWPTFGLKLVSPEPAAPAPMPPIPRQLNPLGGTIGHVAGLVATMYEAHDKLYLERADFVRTITISNLGIRATQFDLGPQQAEALYQQGRADAERFLETWDFDAYTRAFRLPGAAPRSRRDDVSAELAGEA